MKSTKSALRTKLKEELRKGLDDSVSKRVEDSFHSFMTDIIKERHIDCVGVFSPLDDEVKLDWSLLDSFNIAMAFPFFAGEHKMLFKKCHVRDLVGNDGFGVHILSPRESDPDVNPEIVIIPGLGFGPNGERLGRGKGFYDRYLASSQALKIGLGIEAQICENILCDPHDVYLDGLITEQGTRLFKS